jgi:hypothetical protein
MVSGSTPPTMDGYSIWLRVRSAVTSAHYPNRIAYRVAVTGLDGSAPSVDHYRAVANPASDGVEVFPISDEQLAKPPPVPQGVNVSISILGAYIPVGRPQAAQFQVELTRFRGHFRPYGEGVQHGKEAPQLPTGVPA